MTIAQHSPTIDLSDLGTVSRLGFGAMRITGAGIWGEPADREVAKQVVRRAVDLGVDFLDTADAYGPDVSEQIIAEALHPYPEGVKIGTKVGLTRQGPDIWTPVGVTSASLEEIPWHRMRVLAFDRSSDSQPGS